jgi:hypothetical protein
MGLAGESEKPIPLHKADTAAMDKVIADRTTTYLFILFLLSRSRAQVSRLALEAPSPASQNLLLHRPIHRYRPSHLHLQRHHCKYIQGLSIQQKYGRADRQLWDKPFYSIIRPSDRTLVKQYIDTAKSWSPVIQNEKRSGGHGYCKFSVLKASRALVQSTVPGL